MNEKKNGPTEAGDERASQDGPERVLLFADSLREQEPPAEPEEAQELEDWLLCRIDAETFALPIGQVQEVLRVGQITRVPHAPHPVRGVTNLRGHVLPVVDLRLRLGLQPVEVEEEHRIVVVGSKGRLIGLLVDGVDEVGEIDRLQVEDPPADVVTDRSYHIVGVIHRDDRLIILLDVDSVLQVRDVDEPSSDS